MNIDQFIAKPGNKVRLKDYDPGFTGQYKNKGEATEKLAADIQKLAKLQDILYAQNSQALLIILQALDTAGKDGTIQHVMSGVNPQGTQVHSFKAPSSDELDHDFLWRSVKVLPERGNIGIFNRSYYEEVLVVRVHPELLEMQRLPPEAHGKELWKQRFNAINNFEKYLVDNGTQVLKFYLNLSKEEQKKRLLARIDTPDKNWKFSLADAKERSFWNNYMDAFEDMFSNTSSASAPWHIIPADNKWFTRAVVADIIVSKLESMQLEYPVVSDTLRKQLQEARTILQNETS